ncbi:sulfurtransferase TusA family protein [Microvirga antarctica]|uniref:sulfurtransferase TusA family protein n=1 Tax=Microvirga antarctica TaxID=2819233 RepID=UPI001FECE745|nr:sulfurtransferase TusA family protein [Microvirga antarctica]
MGQKNEAPGMRELDLSGLKCPMPALRTRKALKSIPPGGRIRVICTDPLAGIDIPHAVRDTGGVIETQLVEGETLTFVIRRVITS